MNRLNCGRGARGKLHRGGILLDFPELSESRWSSTCQQEERSSAAGRSSLPWPLPVVAVAFHSALSLSEKAELGKNRHLKEIRRGFDKSMKKIHPISMSSTAAAAVTVCVLGAASRVHPPPRSALAKATRCTAKCRKIGK